MCRAVARCLPARTLPHLTAALANTLHLRQHLLLFLVNALRPPLPTWVYLLSLTLSLCPHITHTHSPNYYGRLQNDMRAPLAHEATI
jgi:hypothetical protein